MTATASPAAAPSPTVVLGWTAGRARRARMFAALLALTAAVALWAAFQPWYGWASAGAAGCTRAAVAPGVTVLTPVSNTAVPGSYGAGCITGTDLAAQYGPAPASIAAAQAQLDRQNTNTKQLDVTFGLPRAVVLVLLATVVGALALASRNGWLGLLGVVVFYYAHKDLGALEALVGSGEGGALNQPMTGLQAFGWALVFGWGLLFCATLFVAKHNHDQHELARQAALAAGQEPPPGRMDQLLMFLGGGIARVVDATQTARTRNRQGADTD